MLQIATCKKPSCTMMTSLLTLLCLLQVVLLLLLLLLPTPAMTCCSCSRAFIRAAAQDSSLPVPSPTYLLQLIYEEQEGEATVELMQVFFCGLQLIDSSVCLWMIIAIPTTC
jgi:hypothetical protein